jgi:hypothetical protein
MRKGYWCRNKRKRPLRIPRHRYHENSRIDLEATEMEIVEWIDLAQDREQW